MSVSVLFVYRPDLKSGILFRGASNNLLFFFFLLLVSKKYLQVLTTSKKRKKKRYLPHEQTPPLNGFE